MTAGDAADVSQKLDALIRLTAIALIGDRSGIDAIAILARANLDNDTIASIVGSSAATVRSARSRLGKRSRALP
jgi:hypothetical protein